MYDTVAPLEIARQVIQRRDMHVQYQTALEPKLFGCRGKSK